MIKKMPANTVVVDLANNCTESQYNSCIATENGVTIDARLD
jgi:NAD/NADP transhydrogenase alpha subunit